MKYLLSALLCASLFTACGPAKQPETVDKADSSTTVTPDVERTPMEARILGTYKGDFSGNPIYITINYCSGSKIAGYNTHKGLRRNINGTMKAGNNGWILSLSEPGDHEFDGVFSLTIDTALNKMTGTWAPSNDKSLAKKQLSLTKFDKGDDLGFFQGEHCDLWFKGDGVCILNYYDKINDSTFSAQMVTLRGTWEKQTDSTVQVNWQANPATDKRSTLFTLEASHEYAKPDNMDFVFEIAY